MKNTTSGERNANSKINWEDLEIFWADQYEEDYVTTLKFNLINKSFLSVDFSKSLEKAEFLKLEV